MAVVVAGHHPQRPTARVHSTSDGAREVRIAQRAGDATAGQVRRDHARRTVILDDGAAEVRRVALGAHGNGARNVLAVLDRGYIRWNADRVRGDVGARVELAFAEQVNRGDGQTDDDDDAEREQPQPR